MTNTSSEQGNTRKIGIDLDHTILNIEHSVEDAEILFGFKAFVMARRDAGDSLVIMCHIDGQKESDDAVLSQLEAQGLFKDLRAGGFGFNKSELVFAHSTDENIEKIGELGLTHFIDDQNTIFTNEKFPTDVQPLLFNETEDDSGLPTFSDWNDLTNYFVWERGVRTQTNARLTGIETVDQEGENYVYLLNTSEKGLILKHYAEGSDERHRLETEINHLKALRAAEINNIPEPYWHEGSWAVYSQAPGSRPKTFGDDDVAQISAFLHVLDSNRDKLADADIANAIGARLKYQDYIDTVNGLWKEVNDACQRPDGPKDIMLFMLTDFEQMRQDNLNHFYLWSKRQSWDKEAAFPKEQLIFNPGDFGLHNAVRDDQGQLTFLDFKCSGWDDPVRVLADFFHNPTQQLTVAQRLKVLDNFAAQRDWDSTFMDRFWAVSDLVAVEWILRHLYVVVPEEMRRLQYVHPNLDPKKLVRERFKQAVHMHKEFQPMEHLCKHDQLLDEGREI